MKLFGESRLWTRMVVALESLAKSQETLARIEQEKTATRSKPRPTQFGTLNLEEAEKVYKERNPAS
jgi:hypothetical protein